MASIVDPPPDGKQDARRVTGRITRRDGSRSLADSPNEIAAMITCPLGMTRGSCCGLPGACGDC